MRTTTLSEADEVLDRARAAFASLALDAGLEAGRDPRAHLAPDRGQRRADRAHHRRRGRQAAEGRARRGQAWRLDLPLGERGGQAHRRRDHRDGCRRRRRGPLRLDHPRAARRHRRHLAVQLPAEPGGPQGGAGAGRRQRGGAQAGLEHADHGSASGRASAARPGCRATYCRSWSAPAARSAASWSRTSARTWSPSPAARPWAGSSPRMPA